MLLSIEGGEKVKTREKLKPILKAELNRSREKDFDGMPREVPTDLGGYVASTYKRG